MQNLLADTLTPVNIYLKLRDVFSGAILLESSDYHSRENSLSFICCKPIASFKVCRDTIDIQYPGWEKVCQHKAENADVAGELREFLGAFEVTGTIPEKLPAGLFGYLTYDAVRYFEDIEIRTEPLLIPDIQYALYGYVVVVDHFTNEMTLVEACSEGSESTLPALKDLISRGHLSLFPFQLNGPRESLCSDERFLSMVSSGIQHCLRGDVFQVVLSRRFRQAFYGDEFNVYRALRAINPSPYLFYFDYGSFKIFGSSPESQLQIRGGTATIHPIAGTIRRTGNDRTDTELAERLVGDEKENAEHMMLVDLARNDLSRCSDKVRVEVLKEIQYYSHVIHMVSKVSGQVHDGFDTISLMGSTFPAGTLSGAPKHRAMQLIAQYEEMSRSFYGGAIGFIGFRGECNHAIMIRTFLSKDQQLICQAGAGIVAKSKPENELREVNGKLGALLEALSLAQDLVSN